MSKKFDFLKTVKDPEDESAEPKEAGEDAKPARARAPKAPKSAPQRVDKRGRPATGKRSDPEFEPTTLYMRIKTKRAVRAALLMEEKNRELSDIVEELLAGWASKHSKM